MKVCFIILHYKDRMITKQCVDSIATMDDQENIQMIVVDNDTELPERERSFLKEQLKTYRNLHVLTMQEKSGFSRANNTGYLYARDRFKPDYMVICNNDIEFVQKDFLKRLSECHKKHPFFVLGPDVVDSASGAHQNPMDTRLRTKKEADYTIRMNRWGLKFYSVLYPFFLWNQKRLEEQRQRRNEDDSVQTFQEKIVPCGACLIFSRDFCERERKAFEPETEFYYEEYLLAYRCEQKGYQIIYDPDLKVMHHSGRATNESFKSRKKRQRFVMEKTAEACEVYRKILCQKNQL